MNEKGLALKKMPGLFSWAGFAALEQILRLAAAICGSIAASRSRGWAESGLLSTFQGVLPRENGFFDSLVGQFTHIMKVFINKAT